MTGSWQRSFHCNAVRQTLVYIGFRVRSPPYCPWTSIFDFVWKKIPEKALTSRLGRLWLKGSSSSPSLFILPHIASVRIPIMATQPLGEANEQLWSVPAYLHSSSCLTFMIQGRDLVPPSKYNLLDSRRVASHSTRPDLSSSTVRRNTDLENRVAELEVELSVWKQAHSVALEASEREVKAHNVQIAALNRQISNLDCFKTVRFFNLPWSYYYNTATTNTEPKSSHSLYCKWRRACF